MDKKGLVLDNLKITRGDGPAMVSLSLHIRPGQVLSIMGPSGVGKSALLSCITGTLAPAFRYSGDMWLNLRPLNELAPQQRRIGILFQDHLLFPHMSVGQNLGFGLPSAVQDRAARIETALADIGMAGFADRDPATLSGGQRARVALMRMLLAEPEAVLLDEAFSGLDRNLRTRIRELVFAHAARAGLPVLMVTHDREDADAAGGEVIVLAPPKPLE